MLLRIRLPGHSAASDLALAPQMASVAVEHAQGKSPPSAPAEASNPCADNPACIYLGAAFDDRGKQWMVYACGDDVEAYPA